jgi:O-antigen/teichoic acid export membrane protein
MWRTSIGTLPPFLRNVVVVLSGAVAGQLVVLLCTPILTRLYPVEAFAVSQSFAAASTGLLIAACLKYDAALTAASDEDIEPLILICLIVGMITSTIAAACLVFLGPTMLHKLGIGGLAHINLLFAVGMVVTVTSNALTYLLIRSRSFNDMSKGRVAQPLVFLAIALSLGLTSSGKIGLVIADISGRAVLALIYLFYYRKTMPAIDLRRAWRRLGGALWRYRLFPLLSFPGGILGAVGSGFNTIWMLALFDARIAGAYALVERTTTMPTGVIANAVGQVYQGELSQQLRDGSTDLRGGFRRVLLGQLKIAAAPAVVGMIAAPWLFPVVFGRKWELAGRLSQAVLPLIFVSFIVAPFSSALTLLQRQKAQMSWEAARFLAIVGAWGIVHTANLPPVGALWFISGVSALNYLAFLLICYRQLASRERQHIGQA